MSDGEGPHCALHFDAPSLGTCKRCGRFCCQSCLVEREPALCSACAPTVLDPFGFRAKAFDFVSAFLIAFKLIIAELPRLIPMVILFSLPATVLQVALTNEGDDLRAVSASLRVSSFYEAFIGIIGAQAMLALLIARSEGRDLSFGAALAEGTQNWGRALGARIRSGLTIFVFMLLLILPGFWKATLLMFSSIAALRSKDQDALEASAAVVRGRFGLALLFGLVAIGVCFLPLVFLETVIALIAEELQAPRFPIEFISDVIDRFASDVTMTALLYVAYVMFHRTAGLELTPMRWHRDPPLADVTGAR